MKGLFEELLYIHALFVVFLYLVGNFFTVVFLEYKLKNLNLRHTLAAFASVALSGLFAYLIPVAFFSGAPLFTMQMIAIATIIIIQGLFWWYWFRKNLKAFAPVLALAVVLTVIGALLMYNLFVWYVSVVTKAAVKEAITTIF